MIKERASRKQWVLVTRARDQAEQTARLLRERGYFTLVDPVFETRRVPFVLPAPEEVQAVVITSANAAYAIGYDYLHLPVYAVGRASAHAARLRGVERVHAAAGDWKALRDLLRRDLVPSEGLVLHLSGRTVRGDLAPCLAENGLVYERVVVYETVPREEIGSRTRHALARRAIGAVLLYSPRTAATFARLVRQSGAEPALKGVICACLSEAVAEEVDDLPGVEIVVAPERDQTALLDCLEAHFPRW